MKPCKECPFLIGSMFERSMSTDRAREIADGLRGGGVFHCHKTTTTGGAAPGNEQWCAGALATMENDGGAEQNQMVRIDARLGMLPPDALDNLAVDVVYESLDDWVELESRPDR